MTPRTRTFMILIGICLLSWALVGSFIGCSSEKKEIDPPVVGPAAGSGPMGGGDTQKITLLANPSETVPVPTGQQGLINVTALVENRIGQPMPDGTAVYWSTTIGTLSASTGSVSNGSSDVTLTFPESYTGCSYVTARSGDVQATIKVCVEEVIFTPTPAPPATATPVSVPTPVPTAVVSISLTSSALNTTCASIVPPNAPVTLTATVYRNSIPVTDIPVSFSVSFSPALDPGTNCFVNPTNPPVGTTTSDFLCLTCSNTTSISTATVRATASGQTADVIIAVTQ